MNGCFHYMPFGAQLLPDERVHFRLWAPGASRVDVCLPATEGNGDRELPMRALPEGWFELATDQAAAGTLYRFRIDGGETVPDPASRYQPNDVHGASQVIDPCAYPWEDAQWCGRPWEEAVIYELHVGTFTPAGTFRAARERLGHLAELGVTVIQLMPVAEFPGERNWGYDGALKFAVEGAYGTPDDLKALVQTAHALGMMIMLDVVYNHFGPEGNYLHLYAPLFFTAAQATPWGDAIDFDGPDSAWVRRFFIHNALYWLEEFHFDGLRLDAVHAIFDRNSPDILEELADAVKQSVGRDRAVHLVLENDNNIARYLARDDRQDPLRYVAQWNDDLHHALHILLTGECAGYYADYAGDPIHYLGRALCEGFAYQGEASTYRGGTARGEPSRHLPPTAFVGFLENHDQTGNRPFGERLTRLATDHALRAATAILLLAPSPPLLFMGQEWASGKPFLFFCDFEPELGRKVTEGRRQGFARWPGLEQASAREGIPDPQLPATRAASVLDWDRLESAEGRQWLALHRTLLRLRAEQIVPLLKAIEEGTADYVPMGRRGLRAQWSLRDGSHLVLLANLGPDALADVEAPEARMIFSLPEALSGAGRWNTLPGWSVAWFIREPAGR